MPKIIVTSTFRKGGGAGKKGGAGGLLKYMGTREGVEKLPLSLANTPATKRQKSLVESVIKRIPEAVQYPCPTSNGMPPFITPDTTPTST